MTPIEKHTERMNNLRRRLQNISAAIAAQYRVVGSSGALTFSDGPKGWGLYYKAEVSPYWNSLGEITSFKQVAMLDLKDSDVGEVMKLLAKTVHQVRLVQKELDAVDSGAEDIFASVVSMLDTSRPA